MSELREGRGPGRPKAATRAAIERVAMTLMLSDGYEAVSVDAIAQAAGIGRTTFFRYFGSKPGVVWSAFDDTIGWLRETINSADLLEDPLEVISEGILRSTRLAVHNSEVWLERFALLDTSPSLRAETYEHWERWTMVIVDYLIDRTQSRLPLAIPMAIAGACRGVFVAELRDFPETDEDRLALLVRLERHLHAAMSLMRPLLSADG